MRSTSAVRPLRLVAFEESRRRRRHLFAAKEFRSALIYVGFLKVGFLKWPGASPVENPCLTLAPASVPIDHGHVGRRR